MDACSDNAPPPDSVVLIHGIWMTGREMGLLQYRLGRCGFRTYRFAYASVRHSVGESAAELARFVADLPGAQVHFVAHSLGGLIVRQLFHDFPDQRAGRVVTMGTPHGGSRVAAALERRIWSRWLLGRTGVGGLLGGVPAWGGVRQLGVIAGSLPYGIGRVVARLPAPNDGTVAVEETRLAGMTDHLILPVSHLGLVVSAQAARQTCHFLRHGRFDRTLGPAS